MSNGPIAGRDVLLSFSEAMRGLGWIDGQNIVIEKRWAEGDVDRLSALVEELLVIKVDMIVTGSSAATRAGKSATSTVPIVMLASADAVGEGLVASLSRPASVAPGNSTASGKSTT